MQDDENDNNDEGEKSTLFKPKSIDSFFGRTNSNPKLLDWELKSKLGTKQCKFKLSNSMNSFGFPSFSTSKLKWELKENPYTISFSWKPFSFREADSGVDGTLSVKNKDSKASLAIKNKGDCSLNLTHKFKLFSEQLKFEVAYGLDLKPEAYKQKASIQGLWNYVTPKKRLVETEIDGEGMFKMKLYSTRAVDLEIQYIFNWFKVTVPNEITTSEQNVNKQKMEVKELQAKDVIPSQGQNDTNDGEDKEEKTDSAGVDNKQNLRYKFLLNEKFSWTDKLQGKCVFAFENCLTSTIHKFAMSLNNRDATSLSWMARSKFSSNLLLGLMGGIGIQRNQLTKKFEAVAELDRVKYVGKVTGCVSNLHAGLKIQKKWSKKVNTELFIKRAWNNGRLNYGLKLSVNM